MEQYWRILTQKKYSLCYIGCHYEACVKLERRLNILSAVLSTGALAGLFISETGKFIFSLILAGSQVFAAARPYLPYEKRIKDLEKGLFLFDKLYLDMEKRLFDISQNNLSDEEINQLAYEFENKWLEIDNSILKNDVLPEKEKLREKAEKEKDQYYQIRFGG